MLKFLGACDRFRKSLENENKWQEMMKTKKPITEQAFLKMCNVNIILDEDETWEQYKNDAIKQHTPIKFYKSANGLYFFQTAGFEYIWG